MATPYLTDVIGSYRVDFTRGEKFGLDPFGRVANQDVERTRDGKSLVRINGADYYSFDIVIENETSAVVTQVDTLFSASYVNYFNNLFFYYPDNSSGTYYTVRLTEMYQIRRQESPNANPLYTINIKCRTE